MLPFSQLESIGQCQKWPPTDLYAETTTNTSFPYHNASSTVVTTATVSGKVVVQTFTPGASPSSASSSAAKSSAAYMVDRRYITFILLLCAFGATAILI